MVQTFIFVWSKYIFLLPNNVFYFNFILHCFIMDCVGVAKCWLLLTLFFFHYLTTLWVPLSYATLNLPPHVYIFVHIILYPHVHIHYHISHRSKQQLEMILVNENLCFILTRFFRHFQRGNYLLKYELYFPAERKWFSESKS